MVREINFYPKTKRGEKRKPESRESILLSQAAIRAREVELNERERRMRAQQRVPGIVKYAR